MNKNGKVTLGTARRVIQHCFDEKPKSIKELHGGLVNYVYEAKLKHREVILRISDKPEKLETFRKEQWTVKKVEEINVPAPKILEVGTEAIQLPYMISEKVAGQQAGSHPERLDVLREMGRYAARINSIPTSAFGHVYDWSTDQAPRLTTWKAYLRAELHLQHRIEFFSRHQILTPRNLRRFKEHLKEIENWRARPTLSHGDLRLKNVLVNRRGKVSAILDWENATSNYAPYWELSLALHDLAIDEKEAFLEGYELAPKNYARIMPAVKALNILNYYSVLRGAIDKNDKLSLARLKARLNGHLDSYSL